MSSSPVPARQSMMNFLEKLIRPPFILLMACILAYGLFIPWLGLYSDDWILLATFQKFGAAGLFRYFSTNRPFWGLLYQVSMPLVGKTPWLWHLFGIFWHWTAAVSLYWALRLTWSKARTLALWVGLLFAVYPGFILQPLSITFSHIFIVYTTFFLSVCFLLLALHRPNRYWLFLTFSFLMSLVNLLSMEYFLLLHLLQPVFLWFHLSSIRERKDRLRMVIQTWWPNLALFISILVWRMFFFKYQTQNYPYLFLDRLRGGFAPALKHLFTAMVTDWWTTVINAWLIPFKSLVNSPLTKMNILILSISFLSAILFFFLLTQFSKREGPSPFTRSETWQPAFLGILAIILAGGPFWLTELKVGLSGFPSRFTLPFIMGAAILLASLIFIPPLPNWLRNSLLAVLLGVSLGYQLKIENGFRNEWNDQKSFFWQLAWRIPKLEPGTFLFISDFPHAQHITQNTASAILDWNYHPTSTTSLMDHATYNPSELARILRQDLHADQAFVFDHLGALFSGNTSRSITVEFSLLEPLLGSCVHVISDPINTNNPYLTESMKPVAILSDINLIQADSVDESATLNPIFFGSESKQTRCYFFEKADLAVQLEQWQVATDLYEASVKQGIGDWKETELVPFIIAYAHLGNWQNAYNLSVDMAEHNSLAVGGLLCKVWGSIDATTAQNQQHRQTYQKVLTRFQCQGN